MTREHVGRTATNSSWITLSGSKIDESGLEIGDAIDVSETTTATRSLIDSTPSENSS